MADATTDPGADTDPFRAAARRETLEWGRPPRVPRAILILGAWGWRITAVAAAAYAVLWVLLQVWVVFVPLIIGLFLAAVLEPVVGWLRRRGWPSALATSVVFFSVLVAALLIIGWISMRVTGQLDQLGTQVQEAIDQLQQFLTTPPFPNFSEQRLDELQQQVTDAFGAAGRGGVVQRAAGGVMLVVQLVTGIIVALFTLFFLLKDGRQMGDWLRERTPPRFRTDVSGIAGAVQRVMREYLGGTVVIGLFDAVGIGLALLLLDVPLVLPLAAITFFGAFIPTVGAFVAGALSALVALVSGGLTTALWVIAATIVVQQVEGNVLVPLVMGAAVALHPIVTIYVITVGFIVGGIVGALLAVPFTAMATQIGHWYRTRDAVQHKAGS